MSFWSKIGVKITDLGCFKQSCTQHGIEYIENTDSNKLINGLGVQAELRDLQGPNHAFLLKDGGAFRLYMDTDAHYSSITKRLGRNGGKLTRDYAANVVQQQVANSGGFVANSVENPDGSLVLRVQSY